MMLCLTPFFTSAPPSAAYSLSLHRRSSDLRRATGADGRSAREGRRLEFSIADRNALTGHALFEALEWLLNLPQRSEEDTSELQSRGHLVCRLLLEKKNI